MEGCRKDEYERNQKMSKAYKCDICGSLFSYEPTMVMRVQDDPSVYDGCSTPPGRVTHYDICEGCREEIFRHIVEMEESRS